MPSYSKHEIVLVSYPFSDLSGAKVRPGVVVNADHVSQDLFVVALTSKTGSLLAGEFVLAGLEGVGLERRNGGKARNLHHKRNAGQKICRQVSWF